MNLVLGILVSYLVGSIPTAFIFGKICKGIDIRQHGSGNVGATNVFRVLGKTPGSVVLILDIIKGIIPIVLVADMFGTTQTWERILCGLGAVVGHNWTVFLKFKGGKGVATSLGVLIGLTIKIVAIRLVLFWTIIIWIICFLLSRFISLASVVAATALPILMTLTDQDFEMVLLGVIFCVFVVFRHKGNIKRLFAGEEPRVPLPFMKKNS